MLLALTTDVRSGAVYSAEENVKFEMLKDYLHGNTYNFLTFCFSEFAISDN